MCVYDVITMLPLKRGGRTYCLSADPEGINVSVGGLGVTFFLRFNSLMVGWMHRYFLGQTKEMIRF